MKYSILNLVTKSILAVVCFLSAMVLSSCPTPINEKMFQQVKDAAAPEITVTSPSDGDAYGAYTLVTGVVSDLSDDGADGSVSSLSIEILGVTGNQSISVDDSGNFSTILTTSGAGYSGDIVLKLTALDWNGNSTNITLALEKAEGEIVGFSVTAGNKSSVIDWETLPGATSYTIEDLRNRSSVEGITDFSYTWGGLTNGKLYSFKVVAEIDGGTYYSATGNAIPLAKTTLAPQLESVYGGIKLTWEDIPAASEYIIERAAEMTEGAYSIREITVESSFTDTNIDRDSGYYYRIYPVELEDNPDFTRSNANYGRTVYFPESTEESGSYDTPGSAYDVAIYQSHAYIADGSKGMHIVNISNSNSPYEVGYIDDPSWGWCNGIAVENDYAYMVDGSIGLIIIDISTPSNPVVSDDSSTLGTCYGVDLDGGFAYVTNRDAGLKIIDLSDPSHLGAIETISDVGRAYEIDISGNYAYVAAIDTEPGADDGGLRIIDLTADPKAVVVTYDTPGDARDIAIGENGFYAYVADGTGGLYIVNISDPESPEHEGSLSTTGNFEGIALSDNGGLAYLADGNGKIHVINISDPALPFEEIAITSSGNPMKIAVEDDHIYSANGSFGLRIIDRTIQDILEGISQFNDLSRIQARGVVIRNSYTYIAGGGGNGATPGLYIIDISDPVNPVKTGSYSLPNSNPNFVAISGNYAYLSADGSGLHIFDISDPHAPREIGNLVINASRDIAIKGDYAFIANLSGGLYIVDISNPENPLELAVYKIPEEKSWGIDVYGDYAYIGGINDGLRIIDISDPASPFEAGALLKNEIGAIGAVTIKGNYAYVGSDGSGTTIPGTFNIIDVSDPYNPVIIGYSSDPEAAVNITVCGSYAYLATAPGFQIYDISDPANPSWIAIYDPPGTYDSWDVAVSGSYAYVANLNSGLCIVDLSPGE